MDLNATAPHDFFLQMAKPFRFQWEPAQDCFVILYPEGMVKLNQAAGVILNQCCKERKSVGQTVDDLATEFSLDPQTMMDDVQEFLRIAYDNRWIEQRH